MLTLHCLEFDAYLEPPQAASQAAKSEAVGRALFYALAPGFLRSSNQLASDYADANVKSILKLVMTSPNATPGLQRMVVEILDGSTKKAWRSTPPSTPDLCVGRQQSSKDPTIRDPDMSLRQTSPLRSCTSNLSDAGRGRLLLDFQQLDVEHKHAVRAASRAGLVAVAELAGDPRSASSRPRPCAAGLRSNLVFTPPSRNSDGWPRTTELSKRLPSVVQPE